MAPTLLSELWVTAIHNRRQVALGSLMAVLANALMVLAPLCLRQAVLSVEGGEGHPPLYQWVILLFSMSLLAALLKVRMRILFIAIGHTSEQLMREQLFRRIQRHSRPFYDRHGVGRLMSHLTNDISAVREVLGPGVLYPVNFITLALPAGCALVFIEPWMALCSLTPVISLPLMMWVARKGMYRLSQRVQVQLAELSATTQEQLTAIRLVKSYHAEKPLLHQFRQNCRHFFDANLRLSIVQGLFFPLLGLMTRSVTTLLVLLTGYIVMSGWSDLSTADFVSFMWIQSYLYLPVLLLGWILPVYERGRAAYERLRALADEPLEFSDPLDMSPIAITPPSLAITNLTFSYDGRDPVLHDLSLAIPAGTIVGITGPVGSGKSTLLHLIAREFQATQGIIQIGDHPLHQLTREQLRQMVTLVEQNPFLFSKTMEENLLLGDPSADFQHIQLALQRAALTETIESFPDGLQTSVGERGVTLSGGQKQRMVLARALLADRPLLLIDDLFSGVDASTEQHIMDDLLELKGTHTIVVVAHGASVLDRLDRLYFLHHGQVVEEGNPSDLCEQGGYYAALRSLQGWEGRE